MVVSLGDGTHYVLDHASCTAWYCALLHDDGPFFGVLSNRARGALDSTNIGHGPGTQPLHLGGRVDADEDNVRFGDGVYDLGREHEVRLPRFELDWTRKSGQSDNGVAGAISANAHHLQQTILVDG